MTMAVGRKSKVSSTLQFLAFFLLTLFLSSPGFAAAPYSTESDLSGDFSDFVPVMTQEDAYKDESFMYFGKDYSVSLGAGMQSWSGIMGRFYGPSFPAIDFRVGTFSDYSTWEFGFNFASYYGKAVPLDQNLINANLGINLPTLNHKMNIFIYYVNWKYYFDGDLSMFTGASGMHTTCPFAGVGLAFMEVSGESAAYPNYTNNEKFPLEMSMPIFGHMPIPIPYLIFGTDIALKPGSLSLSLEGRWIPVGTFFEMYSNGKYDSAISSAYNESRIGDMLSATIRTTFVF
jgi:hypothetical protein